MAILWHTSPTTCSTRGCSATSTGRPCGEKAQQLWKCERMSFWCLGGDQRRSSHLNPKAGRGKSEASRYPARPEPHFQVQGSSNGVRSRLSSSAALFCCSPGPSKASSRSSPATRRWCSRGRWAKRASPGCKKGGGKRDESSAHQHVDWKEHSSKWLWLS